MQARIKWLNKKAIKMRVYLKENGTCYNPYSESKLISEIAGLPDDDADDYNQKNQMDLESLFYVKPRESQIGVNTSHDDVVNSLQLCIDLVRKGKAYDAYRKMSGVAHSWWNIYDEDA